jgi:formate--tetrahydrofolate ligase
VCINAFDSDSRAEVKRVFNLAEAAGARVAVSRHWAEGGEGAGEFAQTVIDACEEQTNFKYLYESQQPLRSRIELIAKQVYGAGEVRYAEAAAAKAKRIEDDPACAQLSVCMVKTHLSLTDNPNIKGAPKGWPLFIRDILIFSGAGLVAPVAGNISLMPGSASDPAYRRIDVDVDSGQIEGLF